MKPENLISVIVPVYNVERYLERCVTSLIEQTHKNLEIILVDDGSPDNSGKLCEQLARCDDRIKVIHKENGGLSSARNAGLNVAKGNFLSFIDSDDFIESDMIKKMYDDILQESADIATIGRLDDFEDKESVLSFLAEKRTVYNRVEAMSRLLTRRGIDVSVCDKLFKKELFENIRFPEGENNEDCAIIFNVFEKAEKVVHTEGIGYHYCHRNSSITTTLSMKSLYDMKKHIDKMLYFIKERLPELETEAMFFATIYYKDICVYISNLWLKNNVKTEAESFLYNEARSFIRQHYKICNRYMESNHEKLEVLLIILDCFYLSRVLKRKVKAVIRK